MAYRMLFYLLAVIFRLPIVFFLALYYHVTLTICISVSFFENKDTFCIKTMGIDKIQAIRTSNENYISTFFISLDRTSIVDHENLLF